jgi:murein DD-endopeptidase MepM/ murein hydrolase activator NlpD
MLWLIQIFVPLTLILLLAIPIARHPIVLVLQVGAAGVMLLAVHLAGLWIMPPWWTPWVLWGLFIPAIRFGWRSRRRSAPKASDYLFAMLWTALAGFGGWVSVQALNARTPPPGEIAMLGTPFPAGRYYVANGGSRKIVNAHLRTLPRATIGQRNYWGQSYGVDMIATDRWGLISDGIVSVLAPCDGRVVLAVDGVADGAAVDLASPTARAGNYVFIRCDSFDVLLAHFRKGSVKVAKGDIVRAGQPIGAIGNSGASDMPHLHIHAQRPGTPLAPFSGQPLPMHIAGRYLVRGDRP